ncbi:MAG: YSC84-related protein [Deltaproteobacteria bacterium]|nr:YSC84-related protein [Deltaproteobacteria bacterium]
MHQTKRTNQKCLFLVTVIAILVMSLSAPNRALADSASEIDRKVTEALKTLYDTTPGAEVLGEKAKGMLVFPKVVKFGFLAGTQLGVGALLKEGKSTGYYQSVAVSFGLQAGLQAFDYVLMFMDDESLDYLNRSAGWELGTGPSIVVLNKGIAVSATTTTLRKGIYAFISDQKGVMAGIGLQGTKIIKINPEP